MKRQGHAKQQEALFLALTFVLVFVILLMVPDPMSALIGAVLGLAYASASAGGHARGADAAAGGAGADAAAGGADAAADGPPLKENFYLPGAPPPYVVSAPLPAAPHPAGYPGAIDVDEYDTEPGHGHRDRTEGDNDFAPDGNPFDPSRVGAFRSAGPCVDDEANDDEIDGDERMNYQARARNDPTRAVAGIMNRRRDLDKYLREEVEEEGDRVWWGRHEE